MASTDFDNFIAEEIEKYSSLPAEKPLTFPSNKIYKHRLRLGIPALFRMLEKSGYDIWVYSSSFYSLEYIKALFKRYHVGVTGIVTGTAKRKTTKEDRKIMENLYADKYLHTLHIDNDMVMMIDNAVKEFREFIIDQDGNWSKEVIAIVNTINGKEEG